VSLGKVLQTTAANGQTAEWWDQSKELFVLKRPKSALAAETAGEKQLAGKSTELVQDDGKAAGKASLAGGGHAVRFEAPGDSWYLTGIRIHGSRYGMPAPPKEDFQVWLCDEEFKEIAKFSFPYAKFQRAEPRWVVLKTKPTRVPQSFIICVGFNPTATKGVYVSRDAEGSGNSLTGLPGREGQPYEQGDWMIRATIDQR
jgi:RNA polymerase sigma-70 factor (ECF subfamily)